MCLCLLFELILWLLTWIALVLLFLLVFVVRWEYKLFLYFVAKTIRETIRLIYSLLLQVFSPYFNKISQNLSDLFSNFLFSQREVLISQYTPTILIFIEVLEIFYIKICSHGHHCKILDQILLKRLVHFLFQMEPIKRYLTHLINWFIENPKHSFYLLIRINFLFVYTYWNMFFRVVKFNVSFKLEFLFQNVVKITSISSFEWHQNKLLRCLTNLL